ncbi:hypothetical protein JWJ90_13675 [Desulfobulbus rhabdoformis]|uniref:hypothetical protein n=1 Tax=Desulfobulbus rhabdoformis TaxID=34032 RepID=UPI0019631528|nr:hypothetical protein [Desulfobulbus rhabdoformis]MBM9615329.1 hypothetical protein [Desulfobulbus rhabdoformis]
MYGNERNFMLVECSQMRMNGPLAPEEIFPWAIKGKQNNGRMLWEFLQSIKREDRKSFLLPSELSSLKKGVRSFQESTKKKFLASSSFKRKFSLHSKEALQVTEKNCRGVLRSHTPNPPAGNLPSLVLLLLSPTSPLLTPSRQTVLMREKANEDYQGKG